MATRIRLKRGGRKAKPYYRIVVQDARARRGGPELDIIGFYHPAARPEPVSEVDVHRALDWLKKGAEMSGTARSIMSKLGVLRHYHDGTEPEESVVALTGGVLKSKGDNALPLEDDELETTVEETAPESDTAAAAAETVSAEADADAEPVPAEADAETETL